jgi:creatinine amidohydrolase
MKRALTLLIVVCAIDVSASQTRQSASRIHRLGELQWPQIDAFDRERTMFILPLGMLEEHGPHLPIGSDTFGVTFEAEGVARRVARSLLHWNVVVMPPIEYGQGGANIIGGQLVHPGTYGIRQSTLRALVADVGGQVAQNRFRWIFVLTGHASPPNGMAVNEACDFVSESFAVRMLHVSGLFRADAAIQGRGRDLAAKFFSPAQISSLGLDVHAGASETSVNLALRPELVSSTYRKLPALSGSTREELQKVASRPDWPGYLSAPARATAAYGRAVEAWWVDGLSELVLRAVKGEDLSKAPRAHDRIDPEVASIVGKALEHEQAFETRFEEWLSRRRRQAR